MEKRQPMATYVLVVAGLLFLGTYPFKEYNYGVALIMHMSGAAFIGGLADWYGVTALFRQPLGISFKTAVIPKSRERFIELAKHMVRNELFTTHHIYKGIKDEKILYRILTYVLSDEGRKSMNHLLEGIIWPLVEKLDWNMVGADVINRGAPYIQRFHATPYVMELMAYIGEEEVSQEIWEYVQKFLFDMISSKAVEEQIISIVGRTKEAYIQEKSSRQTFFSILETIVSIFPIDSIDAYIDEKKLGRRLHGELISYVEKQRHIRFGLGKYFYDIVLQIQERLKHDAVWHSQIEMYKMKIFQYCFYETQWAQQMGQMTLRDYEVYGREIAYAYLEKLYAQSTAETLPERQLLTWIAHSVPKLRDIAANMTEKELEKYTGQEMATLLEAQVGSDLQMIRINGSFVGAMLGGIFFLIALVIKGVL